MQKASQMVNDSSNYNDSMKENSLSSNEYIINLEIFFFKLNLNLEPKNRKNFR